MGEIHQTLMMDVFDEGICDDILPEDWAKVERSRRTDGYKEGLAAGQESSLQQGFNRGFAQGSTASFSYSFIKGIINALITSLHPRDQDLKDTVSVEAIQDLEAILSDVESLQQGIRSAKRCSSSGEMSSLSKDAEKKGECEGDGKTAGCVDSETSHNDPSSSSSSFRCHHDKDKVASGETTSVFQKNSPGSTEEQHLFYSHSSELKKIVERLKPHLVQNHCEDILCISHQFLISE